MEESKKHENIKEFVSNTIPSVRNMTSSRGNDIPNQFIITGYDKELGHYRLFQSYDSPIALNCDKGIFLFRAWDYSVTTGKYRNDFLGETKKETLAKLKSGEYIAVDFEVC